VQESTQVQRAQLRFVLGTALATICPDALDGEPPPLESTLESLSEFVEVLPSIWPVIDAHLMASGHGVRLAGGEVELLTSFDAKALGLPTWLDSTFFAYRIGDRCYIHPDLSAVWAAAVIPG